MPSPETTAIVCGCRVPSLEARVTGIATAGSALLLGHGGRQWVPAPEGRCRVQLRADWPGGVLPCDLQPARRARQEPFRRTSAAYSSSGRGRPPEADSATDLISR